MGATVLIIDDSLFMRTILRGALEGHGYRVIGEADSHVEAMRQLHQLSPDIITLDIILPDANGLDLLETIRSIKPTARVVVCSAIGQEPVVQKALGLGASAFLQKPFTPDKVIEVLATLEG